MVIPLAYMLHHVDIQEGTIEELLLANVAFYVLLFQVQPPHVILHMRVPGEEFMTILAFVTETVSDYLMTPHRVIRAKFFNTLRTIELLRSVYIRLVPFQLF